MNSIEQVSLKYLALVVAAERKHRAAHPHQDPALMAHRFWDARSIAKDAGIDDLTLRELVARLAADDLLHWHEKAGRNPTVKLTVKGFSEPPPPMLPVAEKHQHPSPRRAGPIATNGGDIAAVAAFVTGLVVAAGGAALVFLGRVASAQSATAGSAGWWKVVAGTAGLFVGGLLLGASLGRTRKVLASLQAQRRQSEAVGSEA